METRDWYLVQCKPQETTRAQEHLCNQGYETFLPLIEQERIRRRKRVKVIEPLFPGYLFIHLDAVADNWQPIRSTRGVLRLVSFGGLPLPVGDGLIAAIKQRCDTVQTKTALEKGDSVRIVEGAFSNLEAIFDSFDGEERVVILLNLLQQQQRISLPISSIRRQE